MFEVKQNPKQIGSGVVNGSPPAEKEKKSHRLRRRTAKRRTADDEYNALRDIYLRENPDCAVCTCRAVQIHHIVRGNAGRAASLCNPLTWIGVCDNCHDLMHSTSVAYQEAILFGQIGRTINRLRGRAQTAITLTDVAKYYGP